MTKSEKALLKPQRAILLKRDDVLRKRENVPTAVYLNAWEYVTLSKEFETDVITIARPGCARTYPDNIIEIAPMLTCDYPQPESGCFH